MSRRKNRLWMPKSVGRIKSIIALLLDTHPVGFAVLLGKYPFPSDEELHEMLMCAYPSGDLGVHVQAGAQVFQAQKRVESFESERHIFDVLEQYGGVDRMKDVISQYAEIYPENYRILRDMGNVGKPGALSIEALADKYHMDAKTLRNKKERIIEDIAMGMVFYGDDFSLFASSE